MSIGGVGEPVRQVDQRAVGAEAEIIVAGHWAVARGRERSQPRAGGGSLGARARGDELANLGFFAVQRRPAGVAEGVFGRL